MDLNAVAVFVKVVEAGSFSGAARLLKMPKTTVSARFAQLEASLGVTLIQRTTRKLFVTEAGRQYFDRCASAMRLLEEGEAELSLASSRPQGLLRITAPVDVGHTLLPPIVDAYLRRHPEASVELLISNRMADLVGEGIDLAVRAGVLKDSSLVGRRFIDLTANVWTAPAYLASVKTPQHPRDLAALDFIAQGDTRSVELFRGKQSVEVKVKGRARADDFQTIKALLLLGGGIGWLPDFLAHDAAEAGALVPVLPGWQARAAGQIQFVYAGHKYPSPKVRAFIDLALEMAEHTHSQEQVNAGQSAATSAPHK
ncbi:MAG: LysR family transcriptional regulator [Polaromonas sp.]|nr:LysR family transcriptional regulator [Polaromonas sp.]